MERIKLPEHIDKPSKVEVFQALSEELFKSIAVQRYVSGLDFDNFEIFIEEFLYIISGGQEPVNYSKSPEFLESKDTIFDNLKTLIGWEISLRLTPEDREMVMNDIEKVAQVNWHGLLDMYANIMCDSKLQRQYLKKLAQIQKGVYEDKRKIIQKFNTALNSVMQRPIIKTNSLVSRFRPGVSRAVRDFFFQQHIHTSNVLISSDVMFNFHIFEEGLYQSSSSYGLTSGLVNDSQIITYFSQFTEFIDLLKAHKDFSLNELRTLRYSEAESSPVLFTSSRVGLNWIDYMVDYLLFDYEIRDLDGWRRRLRMFQQYLSISVEQMSENIICINSRTPRATYTGFPSFESYDICDSFIVSQKETEQGKLYEHKSGLYLLNQMDSVHIVKPLEGQLYVKLMEIKSQDSEISGPIMSTYYSALRSISKICMTQEQFKILDGSQHVNEIMRAFVCSRLNKLTESVFLYEHSELLQSQFTTQMLTAFDIRPLYDRFQSNKLDIFSQLIDDYKQRVSVEHDYIEMINIINREKINTKMIKETYCEDTQILGLVEKIRNKRTIQIDRYLKSLDDLGLQNLLSILESFNTYRYILVQEIDHYRCRDMQEQFQDLLSNSDYRVVGTKLHILRDLNLDQFLEYIEDEENLSHLIIWVENIIDSFEEFTQSNDYDDPDIKRFSFNYILELVRTLQICKKIPQGYINILYRRYNNVFYKWAERLNSKVKSGYRSDMKILLGTRKMVTLTSNEEIYKMLKKILMWFFINNDTTIFDSETIKELWSSLDIESQTKFLLHLSNQGVLTSFYKKLIQVSGLEDSELVLGIEKMFAVSIGKYYRSVEKIRFSKHLYQKCGLEILFEHYQLGSLEDKFAHYIPEYDLSQIMDELIDTLSRVHLRQLKPKYTAMDILENLQKI